MAGRFLSLFGPMSRFLPEINSPTRKVSFNEKLFWTAMALIIYLVMSEVSLYNVTGGLDNQAIQIIFASQQGKLTALGIGPIVTGGLILQLLIGSGIVNADLGNSDDRSLFTAATKVFAIVLTGVQASAYLLAGVYGPDVGVGTAVIVFVQLLIAGIVLLLLDEMLQKGWGIGSGISLFILAGVAQNIIFSSFSPFGPLADGKLHGAFIALGQSILNGEGLAIAFFRLDPTTGALTGLPSMLGFITTVVVFVIVIYMEGIRVELPISHANYRGFRGKYPIKLLYVSNLPVIFASALFANIQVFAQLLYGQFGSENIFVQFLGRFDQSGAIDGLAYFVTAPRSLQQVGDDPVRALIFVVIMVTFAIIFSITWLEVGGLGPSTVAKQLVDSGMQIPGFRRSGKSIETILKRYIPVVTIVGGAIIGLVASVSEFFGVFGSGMGVLLAVGILYQYYQLLVQEQVAEMYPAFGRVMS